MEIIMKHRSFRKSIFSIVVLLVLSLCLASCSEWDVDVPEGQILLVTRGRAHFNIVKTGELTESEEAKVDAFVSRLRSLGIKLDEPIKDDEERSTEIEFIFGTGVKGRDGALVTKEQLGTDGLVNEVREAASEEGQVYSIVVAAATPELFSGAVDTLLKEGLGIDDNTPNMGGKNLFMNKAFAKSNEGTPLNPDSGNTDGTTDKFEYPPDSGTYPLNAIKVGNVDLSKYVIRASQDETTRAVVTYLRLKIFENSGIKLYTEDELADGEGAEYIFNIRVSQTYSGAGFSVKSSGNTLFMSCAKPIRFMKAAEQFVSDKLVNTPLKTVNLGDKYEWDISYKYSEFGATNNGELDDDFPAVMRTHEMANMYGINVVADSGFTYYFGRQSCGYEIPVKTNVDFKNATFILDDTLVNPFIFNERVLNVFNIMPSDENKPYLVPASKYISWGLTQENTSSSGSPIYKRQDGTLFIKKGQRTIPEFQFGESVMVRIQTNAEDERVYIRYGANASDGSYKSEIILVNQLGQVDASTPVLFDYATISEIEVFPIDEMQITVNGGNFITRANQLKALNGKQIINPETGKLYVDGNQYYYFGRGIMVSRSKTVIQNLNHTIEEGSEKSEGGYPYRGWLDVSYANAVLIDSVRLTGHSFYIEDRDGAGKGGGTQMGTYDINAKYCNNVTWKNCIQNNSITDSRFWGIMGTNFVKNLNVEGGSLSRFDAHQGVYNATVRGATIGKDFNIVGAGTLTVENVTRLVGDCFFKLRNDYGSTWEGDVIITDCSLEGYKPVTNGDISTGSEKYEKLGIFDTRWVSHDFGYPCYMPKTVTINNFTYPSAVTHMYIYMSKRFNNDKDASDKYIFDYINPSAFTDAVNPYHPTEKIVFNNTQKMLLSNRTGLFKELEAKGKLVIEIQAGVLDKNHGA